ncbi:DUF1611 domain-containing protein [Pseudochelatococcus contaminans]|uniref:Putative NAD-dependent epimerase/dehydratase family protein n=1 Tax=Pseudochelatococcus contaminans TaxID=1538103 RepID=A0A7W5Z741_9HYPH|nr:DUF1611 domain-containing protein [Pseudochelatococcus contaminans]MBB3811363.1 putative NAD-dependent epimerase/dehydratase family protein [Pseudochelatococcus contaminans]
MLGARCSPISTTFATRPMRGLPEFSLPGLEALRDLSLTLARIVNPGCKVVGVSLNTSRLTDDDALEICARTEAQLGLPVVDPFRHGADRLVTALDTL